MGKCFKLCKRCRWWAHPFVVCQAALQSHFQAQLRWFRNPAAINPHLNPTETFGCVEQLGHQQPGGERSEVTEEGQRSSQTVWKCRLKALWFILLDLWIIIYYCKNIFGESGEALVADNEWFLWVNCVQKGTIMLSSRETYLLALCRSEVMSRNRRKS